MAKAQGDEQKLKDLYLTVLYWSVLICSSTSVGVALVTSDLVDIVLGPNWIDVKPLMPWLALAYGLMGCSASVIPALDTVGKPQISAALQWSMVIAFVVFVVPAAWIWKDVEAVAITRLVFAVLVVPCALWLLGRCLHIRAQDILAVFWKPALASAMMTLVVLAIQSVMSGGLLRLALTVLCGALAYAGMVMGLWYAVGCPPGPEKVVRDLFVRKFLGGEEPRDLPNILTASEAVVHRTSDSP
jgi:O-antigen/teichoic acid export membrane protein